MGGLGGPVAPPIFLVGGPGRSKCAVSMSYIYVIELASGC